MASLPSTSSASSTQCASLMSHASSLVCVPRTQTINIGPGAYLAVAPLPSAVMTELELAVQDARDSGHLQQRMYKAFGKTIPFPRLTGLFASKEVLEKGRVCYTYSGGTDVAVQETKAMRRLRKWIEAATHSSLNASLVNYYDRGNDSSIGRHSDDEGDINKSIDGSAFVVGVNWIKPKNSKEVKRIPKDVWRFRIRKKPPPLSGKSGEIVAEIELEHGTMFAMCGPNFQKEYTHEIPKGSKTMPHEGERVSFTYRNMIPQPSTKRKRGNDNNGSTCDMKK